MAAIMRRWSGRPAASSIRSVSGMVWSCQGAPSSSSAAAPGISAADCSGVSAVTPNPSRDTSPAKKPLSQVRCSGVNGAVSGIRVGIGGGRA